MKGFLHGADPASEQGVSSPALLPAGTCGAGTGQGVRAEGQGTKKEQRPHLPRKRGPKCARPGEKERRGWREKGNRRVTGERGRREGREARPNSRVYARATAGQTGRQESHRNEGRHSQIGQLHRCAKGLAARGSVPHGREPALTTRGRPQGTNVTQWLSPTTQRKQGAVQQSQEPGSPGAGTTKGLQSKHRKDPGPFPLLLPCCEQGARQNRGTSSAPRRLQQQNQPRPSTRRGPSRHHTQQYCAGFFLSAGLRTQAETVMQSEPSKPSLCLREGVSKQAQTGANVCLAPEPWA